MTARPRTHRGGFAAQQTEAAIGVAVLNRMLVAGRPDSVRRQPVTTRLEVLGWTAPRHRVPELEL
jgi:hypothetical protein